MADGEGALTQSEVKAALDRVLAGSELRTSPRMARLLIYLVVESLDGRAERLKGPSIAMDVFDRGADFDPRIDAVVRSEARRLRQALASYYVGPGAEDPVLISIPKGGYGPVFARRSTRAIGPEGSPGAADEADAAPTQTATRGSVVSSPDTGHRSGIPHGSAWPGRRMAVFATLLACVVGLSALVLMRSETSGGEAQTVAATTPSVLITPLEATGSLDGIEELASGMTAQIIADLMRFNSFRLYDYRDSQNWKDTGGDQATGSPVEADFIVRGVLRGDADKLSIVMRLIDTSDGQVIWSDSFSRTLAASGISGMQAEVSGEIAAKFGEPYGVLRKSFKPDASLGDAAMTSFICVMQAYTYRHTNQAQNYPPVRACLEDAVTRDPSYAEAWAMLAVLRLDGGRFGYDGPTAEAKDRAYAAARAAATRALALEPENVAATSALAMIEHYSGRFEESLEYSRRSVDLNPNDPSILGYHGWRLFVRGQYEEGLAFIQQAIDRSANPVASLFHIIAVERLMKGDMEGMLTAAQRASVDGSSVSDAFLAIAYGGLGQSDEAEAALQRMAKKWPLLAQDPAAAFGWHNLHPDIIAAIVAGLRVAGWRPPESLVTNTAKP